MVWIGVVLVSLMGTLTTFTISFGTFIWSFLMTYCWLWKCTLRKKCSYSELFWSAFFRIRTKYGEILRVSPYSVQMWENGDQNNSEYGHFLRSGIHLLRDRHQVSLLLWRKFDQINYLLFHWNYQKTIGFWWFQELKSINPLIFAKY